MRPEGETASRPKATPGLRADQEWLQPGEAPKHLAAFQLPANNNLTGITGGMDLERRLSDLQSNCAKSPSWAAPFVRSSEHRNLAYRDAGVRFPDAARVAFHHKEYLKSTLGNWTYATMRGESRRSISERKLMAVMVARLRTH